MQCMPLVTLRLLGAHIKKAISAVASAYRFQYLDKKLSLGFYFFVGF